MKIVVEQATPVWVWQMIYKVRDTYLKSLRNKMLFRTKLDNLVVHVYLSDTIITRGGCIYNPSEDLLKLEFYLNPKDSKKYLAFVISHEFAHLLFCHISDFLGLSGKAKDGSTNHSAIIRIDREGHSYGTYFEEVNADYIAHIIVSKLDYTDEYNQYRNMMQGTRKEQEIVRRFEHTFGESLSNSEFLDMFLTKDNSSGKNYYWNSIMSYAFNNIIDIYDEVMGEGAFRELSDKIDLYFKTSSYYDEEAEGQNDKFLDEILDVITEFSKKI